MLKISFLDIPRQRVLVVEGQLVPPWTEEFARACEKARTDLEGRRLIIDLKGVTAISTEGKTLLLELLRSKTKLRCGVYLAEVLRQAGRDAEPQRRREASDIPRNGGSDVDGGKD